MSIDGDKLRKLRIDAGHSQEEFAAIANVDRRTIQRAEAGETVALKTTSRIAEALGVPLSVIRIDQNDEGTTMQNTEVQGDNTHSEKNVGFPAWLIAAVIIGYGMNTYGMSKQNDFASRVYDDRANDCQNSGDTNCLCYAGQSYDRLAPTMLNYLIPLTFAVSDSKERDC